MVVSISLCGFSLNQLTYIFSMQTMQTSSNAHASTATILIFTIIQRLYASTLIDNSNYPHTYKHVHREIRLLLSVYQKFMCDI